MAKSQTPTKARGRPKSKSDTKVVEKERSKSRGRPKSRGRSPTPKTSKARKPSAKRSVSRPRSRARSASRKSEPKPRSRSSSRAKQTPAKKAATPDKKVDVAPTRVSRRTIAAREAAKGKTVVDGPKASSPLKKASKVTELWQLFTTTVKNFGYRRTAVAFLWFIGVPFCVTLLHLMCTRDRCWPRTNITVPANLRTWVDLTFIAMGTAAIALQALLSAIPLGSVVSGFGYRRAVYKYRSNGFLCLILSCGAFYAFAHYSGISTPYVLQSHRFKSLCAMTIVSFIFATIVYLLSHLRKDIHLNHGSACSSPANGNILHDFVHGREVSPKIGQTFDLGCVTIRATNFLWAVSLYSAVQLAKNEQGTINYNVAFVAAAQATYILLGSFFEITILKSAFINQGLGFLSIYACLVLTPFCATLPIRFLIDAKFKNEHIGLYITLYGLYCVGLFLIYHTNHIKYQNARAGGKKVVRTGGYALVRHPNYLGELICVVISTALCGKAVLPWAYSVYLLLLLICRSRLCEKNTNYEYKQYAEQVRSRIIPLIY